MARVRSADLELDDDEIEARAHLAFSRKGIPEFFRNYFLEGFKEAFREGWNEGRRNQARKILLMSVEDKFHTVDFRLRSYVEGMSDIDELERLILQTLDIETWEELMPHELLWQLPN